ncbi:hypothetical protein PtrSN002B_004574 [Pyrenophora tritici-repentis]|nr:hypothetical protein PtrV1_03670 [Pyrenophora tritici-repentis]KAI0578125.1 hypothetical protein Alg215_06514 [Pyrenophora tritici-repentis]KAI0586242.1 hypothetical protein Alg130_04359 [Pyrenophora tritici-repentis]KAI0610969.1 hypothetical protein TUN205_04786 [Pyrenophora tritici-repentis]KAI0623490.1 hypothetical protein TUN199_04517 [Pyrenophora tritici-repentis]
MADKIAPILMDLPLEVRHAIFKYVAARDVEPRKLLRYWLEKKEVKALIAQEMTNNPNAPTPQAVYSDHEEPHRKWRHVPKFMRLTQCPPPVELLLTCQELNNEAKNWFYDVATLRIDATGSFAHTSFFEETFSQITDAAFSPMKNIRKVEVTFVWDSTWIRADTAGCVGAIFPALLGQRSSFVHRILLMAPDLKEVVIHWHDSAHDDESVSLMLDTLAPFHTLPATILIHEHYIPADARPNKRSTAGKRRVEFQNILDMGLDRLF